jgi:hypothetical protein
MARKLDPLAGGRPESIRHQPIIQSDIRVLFEPGINADQGRGNTDQGQDYYEERYRQRILRHLAQRAEKMGMKLVASEQSA